MKYKNINIIYIVYFVVIGFLGCKKGWLEEKANKQQSIPKTLNDYQALLNNEVINNAYSPLLAELASDGHYISESAWLANSDNNQANAYTWSNNRIYGSLPWSVGGYATVFNMNVVLDGLKEYKTITNSELEMWNNIYGQALFHRSFVLFRIAQVWAPPYNSASAESDLGIPLRLEADISIASFRTTVKQTYEQIVSDLLTAKNLLPVNLAAKTRPNKLATFALLSRIYQSMRDYDKAGAYADSVLRSYNSLMDYNELSSTSNYIGSPNSNQEVIFHQHYQTSTFLTTNCFVDVDLYNSYESDDLRKTIFFKKNSDGSVSFKGNYNSNAFSFFCGLAIDELYLIRAESYARSGNVGLAMQDLNDLLRTRYRKTNGISTYVEQNASDASDAMSRILTERKKELLMRSIRWSDLRRLNFEDEYKITITRTISGNTYVLEPGSFRYTFPIPNEVISRSGMKQNVGWE